MRGKSGLRLCIACWAFAHGLALAEGGPGPGTIGAGGFPITSTHASAWFASRADSDTKTLTLIVFFAGAPGWHDKATKFGWDVKKDPSTIDMKVGVTAIHVTYSAGTRAVVVMGHDFDLAKDNTFLVTGIDEAAPVVKGLGSHDLTFAGNDNPALVLLMRDASVLGALLGEPLPERKTASDPPGELVAADKQGVDLLAKNTPEDDQRACELFRKAAAGGYAPSQYRLGVCYGTGRGVKEDLALANDWYRRAAEQDYVDAQYKLAHSYRVGRGVTVDLVAARKWYARAADNGDVEAEANLGMMYATGQGAELDPAKAFAWYLKAAENDEPSAQFVVAGLYRDGAGVSKSLTSAYAWLLVLGSHRQSIAPEDWKQVEGVLRSVEPSLSPEAKVEAEAIAREKLRSCSKVYLRNLHR